ncbi:hypothetical protein NFX46_36580 [Streptomyces phaeoluteigriseus]|uniref:Uncharacterized protein n=1 Tax=Streptomyces phaeoluteigriseus TaxID=114686 RepID=A0ABY4ZI46_9ACTN|nr:hypothetical protein [Streptomyces phaeoluteigriseus]USQ88784.1 hypothetical protein NFX46_36580 [Streptomyces phaeoluteigriseus]
MPSLQGEKAVLFGCSAVARVGGAVFVVASDEERLQQLYYRVDAGVSAIWRSFRGYELRESLLADAASANEKFSGEFPPALLPREFMADYSRLARKLFRALPAGQSTVTGTDFSEIALRAAGTLAAGVPAAREAAEFERSCQEEAARILSGDGPVEESAVREIRKRSGVWALQYQRLVRPQ